MTAAPQRWRGRPVQAVWSSALLLSLLVPWVWILVLAVKASSGADAWRHLWADPQTLHSLALAAWTGLASTAIAWFLSAWLLAQGFVRQGLDRMMRWLPVMLATPHAALAIGVVFLVAPSGWLLRLVSPGLTGMAFPPPWTTTQDPWGLGLIAVLVFKEVPFLLWTAASQLQREDVRRRWRSEHSLAKTLGYSEHRAWWLVIWPQLAPRLYWPLVAVLAYGLTVVDMALVIGPTNPPTLAVLAWQWLIDADLLMNAQGAAAAMLLAGLVLLGGIAARIGLHWPRNAPSGRRGQVPMHMPPQRTPWVWQGLMALYAAVLASLAVGSVAGIWPFPRVLPQAWTWQAWGSVWQSAQAISTTVSVGLASTLLCLVWSVVWLELAPKHVDRWVRPVLYLPLVLPGVLWVVGVYGLVLQWRWEGRWIGLLLAHGTMVLPYVMLALTPAYQGFDARYAHLSASLGHSRWHFLRRVKWPLLKRSLLTAAAVGFAVSVAQYLPTLYVGAGRWNTVTTEAVTLAAGAQRSLTSAYAWLQLALPALGFMLAAWAGRPRRFLSTDR